MGVGFVNRTQHEPMTYSRQLFHSLYSILRSIPSSALEQIKAELQDVSDHVKSLGRVGSNEDTKAVSELLDYIRDAVTNYQVSDGAQAVPII